jgi:hypothetical protein
VTYIARSLMKLQAYKLQKKREKKHTQFLSSLPTLRSHSLNSTCTVARARERDCSNDAGACRQQPTRKKPNLSRSVMYKKMYPSMLYIRILYTNICTSTVRVKGIFLNTLKTSREHFAERKSQCWVGIWFFENTSRFLR